VIKWSTYKDLRGVYNVLGENKVIKYVGRNTW